MFEWKPYYRRELESPNAHAAIQEMFAQAEEMKPLTPIVEAGGVLSFPHTALSYAGPLQAQVIVGLSRAGVTRVVALGVLHVWGHAGTRNLYRTAMDETEEAEQREEAFAALRGAFTPLKSIQSTPFGSLTISSAPSGIGVRPDEAGLLADEFSLDTFMSLLSFYHQMRDTTPPEVIPVYIGMTRDPISGSFSVATQTAEAIRGLIAPGTGIVATGDLVHYGTAYTRKEQMAEMPVDQEGLAFHFRREVERALRLALVDRDYPTAFRLCDGPLNNDQRYLLPVVAELLSPSAKCKIIAFSLSDYARIWGVEDPCVVASALVAYVPERGK